MIKAIIFDLDETLIDWRGTMDRFLVSQHGRFPGLKCVPAEFTQRITQYLDYGYGDKLRAYTRACEELGEDAGLPERLLLDFRQYYGVEAVAFDGIPGELARLAGSYTLAIITNGRCRGQNAKIDAVGIRGFFRSIKVSETEGCKKPDPLIFERCLADLGFRPSECVFVGDHPENDVLAARRCGMRGVWIRHSRFAPPEDCDGIIDTILDLESLLQTWDLPFPEEDLRTT